MQEVQEGHYRGRSLRLTSLLQAMKSLVCTVHAWNDESKKRKVCALVSLHNRNNEYQAYSTGDLTALLYVFLNNLRTTLVALQTHYLWLGFRTNSAVIIHMTWTVKVLGNGKNTLGHFSNHRFFLQWRILELPYLFPQPVCTGP